MNLAARIEGLTGKLGKRLLVSADFAQAAAQPMTLVGSFALKGVDAPAAVYEP